MIIFNYLQKRETKYGGRCTFNKRWGCWALLCVISIIQPNWVVEAKEEWKNDQVVWMLIQNLQKNHGVLDNFVWKKDSLCYKDHLYICNNFHLKQKVLLELHTSPIGGHSGFLKIYHRVKKDFFGKVLNIMFGSLWQNVWFSKNIRWRQLRPWVLYNH